MKAPDGEEKTSSGSPAYSTISDSDCLAETHTKYKEEAMIPFF